jgi:hypothetical protein
LKSTHFLLPGYAWAHALLSIFLIFSSQISAAQSVVVPPEITARVGERIEGVREDFTTPALTTSNLKPAQPLIFFNDYPHYTLELLRVQWRADDPIDLYVMKPKGVKKPPVIMYLYG